MKQVNTRLPDGPTRSVRPPRPRQRNVRYRFSAPVVIMCALVLASIITIYTLPTREGVGLAAIALMIVLLLMKVPIAFALIIPGVIGISSVSGSRAVENVISATPLAATSVWSLTVLPMFILMGMLLAQSGVTGRLYEAARLWLGWVPGGLAFGTNVAGAGLASVSGSTIANTYALGRIGIPEMLRAGYNRRLAVGSVIVAGLPGQVIPPSTFLIVVAGITGASVGPQLIAGVVPGVLMVLLFGATIVLLALIWPSLVGRKRGAGKEHMVASTWRVRFRSLVEIWPIIALFVAIFGGLFGGILTALRG